MVHVPIMDEGNKHPVYMADVYDDLIAEINALEQHFMSANLVRAESDNLVDGSRSDQFGPHHVTCQIAYPIPWCDMAVETNFRGSFLWLFDAPMGYHQISVSEETQEKLAFQGSDAIKWTYTVMPLARPMALQLLSR